MPILFGTLWKNAQEFSDELERLAFEPLQGELLVWWYIFRNVQVDLQINAQTLNKAKFLTVQEWVILTNVYNTAKEYYYKSVADLIKQKMSASFTSFSAAEPLVVDEKTKEYLIGKNINENDIQRGLISFINSLDVHFYNLARISPVSKLLREYRNRIGLIMPYDGVNTDVEPPTYGSPPIYTNPAGAIELLYDPEEFQVNTNNELSLISKALVFEPPLLKNDEGMVELLMKPPLAIGDDNAMYLALNYDYPLHQKTDSLIELLYQPPLNVDNTTNALNFKFNDEQMEIDHLNRLHILTNSLFSFIEPLRLTNNTEISIGFEAPLFETGESNLGVAIDNLTIILNEHNQLEAIAQTPKYASPLYLNPHKELTLNYTPVFGLNEQQQLDLHISKPLIFDSNHDLTIDYSGGLWLSNNQLKINLASQTPLKVNNHNELFFSYTHDPTMYIYWDDDTQRLSFNVNAGGTLDTNNGLDVLTVGTWSNETGTDFCTLTNGVVAGIVVDTASGITVSDSKGSYKRIGWEITYKNQMLANTEFRTTYKDKINSLTTLVNTFKQDIDTNNEFRKKLRYTNQLLSQVNNRLTILDEISKCSDEILYQDHYRFQNKIQRGGFRNDTLFSIPDNKKIVNVKGTFFIQHNYAGYKFATFTLDRFQKYSFETHPNNLYYVTYIGYFSTTMANPLYLRIYQEGNLLKYYVYSANITPNEGYNIECDFQVITCDSQDTGRTTWKLITGDIFLNNVEWKYKLPNNLNLISTETISLTWTYEQAVYTSAPFRVSFGTWVSLYLNGHSGNGWDFKIIDKFNFSIKSIDTTPLIQNLAINIV